MSTNIRKSNKASKTAVIAMVALLLLTVWILISILRNEDNSIVDDIVNDRSQPSSAQVNIHANAIVPSTVLIEKGSQVTFTNVDNNAHRLIQSPVDEKELEEFDDREKITPKASFSYIFEKTGTYVVQTENSPNSRNLKVIVQ